MSSFLIYFFLVFLFNGCSSLYLPPSAKTELPLYEPKEPIRIALVLGGGGSRGLAHLGAIKELEAAGMRPDLIIGCSAGAMVGAFYADDPDLKDIEKTFFHLKRSDLLDVSFFGSRFGLVKGKALQNFMEKNLHAKTFEQLKIPLIVVATDLFTGESVEISQKDIPIAVKASCALPGVFNPVLLYGRYLIDGGAASPVPVEIAKKYGAEFIIAIDVSQQLPSSKPYHLFGVAKRGLEIVYQKAVEQALAKADIAIKMDFQDVGIFDDQLNAQIYVQGRIKALSMLPEIQAKLAASRKAPIIAQQN